MDRRAKKIEQKRKNRDRAKKVAAAQAARRPDAHTLLIRSAVRGEFGPCLISSEWRDTELPALVSVIVTRKLPNGMLLPALALVDRTCLGVKNSFVTEPMVDYELAEFVDKVGQAHGGMLSVEPLVAQSIVFNAIDYARSLGFEPHPDFVPELFGPRPEVLIVTPWSASHEPIFVPGPEDNVPAIMNRLTEARGPEGFRYIDPAGLPEDDDELDDVFDAVIIHSPLERHISRDGVDLHIRIYRGEHERTWILEVDDPRGGSSAWTDRFDTDQEALDAAMFAIEKEGVSSFLVSGAPEASSAHE